MLQLKFSYLGHLMRRVDSLEKTLMLGKNEGIGGIINSMDMTLSKLWELVMLSNHLILCCSLLLLTSFFPSIRVFSNESTFHIR